MVDHSVVLLSTSPPSHGFLCRCGYEIYNHFCWSVVCLRQRDHERCVIIIHKDIATSRKAPSKTIPKVIQNVRQRTLLSKQSESFQSLFKSDPGPTNRPTPTTKNTTKRMRALENPSTPTVGTHQVESKIQPKATSKNLPRNLAKSQAKPKKQPPKPNTKPNKKSPKAQEKTQNSKPNKNLSNPPEKT